MRYIKNLFVFGAIWNLVAGILFTYLSLFSRESLSYLIKIIPNNMLWFHIVIFIIVVFGIGYYWISTDPQRNRDIIKLGVIGKIGVFIFWLYGWQTGVTTFLFFLVGCGDLVLTFLYIHALVKLKELREGS